MCKICAMAPDIRTEIETSIRDGVSVRQIGTRFGCDKNTVNRHKNVCMAPKTAEVTGNIDKMRVIAEKLEKKGDLRGAAIVLNQLVNSGEDTLAEDVFGYLSRISPRLCPDCKAIILDRV